MEGRKMEVPHVQIVEDGTNTELAEASQIGPQPAKRRGESMSAAPGRRIPSYVTDRELYDAPKLTMVLMRIHPTIRNRYDTPELTVAFQRIGLLTGMLLFSVTFYYGLARLVMWATSL
jgi:hypothetical protein